MRKKTAANVQKNFILLKQPEHSDVMPLDQQKTDRVMVMVWAGALSGINLLVCIVLMTIPDQPWYKLSCQRLFRVIVGILSILVFTGGATAVAYGVHFRKPVMFHVWNLLQSVGFGVSIYVCFIYSNILSYLNLAVVIIIVLIVALSLLICLIRLNLLVRSVRTEIEEELQNERYRAVMGKPDPKTELFTE